MNGGAQVPPALNRFTKAVDKNVAATLFKLLLKYRPEDKAAKKARLLKEVRRWRSLGTKPCAPFVSVLAAWPGAGHHWGGGVRQGH